jgi:hypothetical protein
MTLNAQISLSGSDNLTPASFVSACNWEQLDCLPNNPFESFNMTDAVELMKGREVKPPDCPACCALMDAALEMRSK